ncbi:YdeI/OmpD-associated family protein [Chryseolinea lacunae]|uniref:YdeI/OmpD-associated family protein n=1 Tax=Chryseolinea lacunae TaxID=2801331 RepID=A0ABS1KND3_9BACT|nr:YdeI/OmpD-associated family protein [Chryseolinea lacunae]MBL0740951.1 YdeI/OmpD-associated family protein [Chryseolinea lacunae]
MKEQLDGTDLFYAKDQEAWRRWLHKNHAKKKSVWLVNYKPSSGKPRISHSHAVDEALCYGWIDSKKVILDELRTVQFFSQRKPKGNWSAVNKKKVAVLVKENRMQPAGLAVINVAKKNGAWTAMDDVEKLIVPKDLAAALTANPEARAHFSKFPPSSKKIILYWVHSAKQAATREKRIAETVALAAKNIRANHYVQPKKTIKS